MPGLNPQNHEIMTWAKTKSEAFNQLNHPGTPVEVSFYLISTWWDGEHMAFRTNILLYDHETTEVDNEELTADFSAVKKKYHFANQF